MNNKNVISKSGYYFSAEHIRISENETAYAGLIHWKILHDTNQRLKKTEINDEEKN